MNMGESSEYDGWEYLHILVRYWWLLILAPLVVGGIAYGLASSQTPIYQSATRILVQQSSGVGTPNLADINLNIALVRTYTELVGSRAVRELAEPSLSDEARVRLSVSAEVVPGTQILRIISKHKNPQVAADTANAFARAFIDFIQTQQFQAISRLQAAAAVQEAAGIDSNLLVAQLQAATALSVIDEATPPESPASPQVRRITVLAVFFGLILAIPSGFVLNRVRNRVETLDIAEHQFGLVPLGAISRWSQSNDRGNSTLSSTVASDNDTPSAEQFRSLRANLQFRLGPTGAKVIAVTSAGESEGKSSVCSNLASVLAFDGMSVVLVDADLRRPSIHTIFGIPNTNGLSSYLSRNTSGIDEFMLPTDVPGLSIITSGPMPPNPAELLNSSSFGQLIEHLRGRFDIVLIDTPPVNVVADASLVGSQVDGTLVVADARKTRIPNFRMMVKRLHLADAMILGVVVNKAQGRSNNSYYYRTAERKRSVKSVLRAPLGWFS
jgi:succinoglycan biosynthesis transport protein ExoP